MEEYEEEWARLNEQELYDQWKNTIATKQGTNLYRSLLLNDAPEEWCIRLLNDKKEQR